MSTHKVWAGLTQPHLIMEWLMRPGGFDLLWAGPSP